MSATLGDRNGGRTLEGISQRGRRLEHCASATESMVVNAAVWPWQPRKVLTPPACLSQGTDCSPLSTRIPIELMWYYPSSKITLGFTFPKGTKVISCTLVQALVLMIDEKGQGGSPSDKVEGESSYPRDIRDGPQQIIQCPGTFARWVGRHIYNPSGFSV